MNRNYDLIVFDWDGTLMDSAGKIVACFRAAAADVGAEDPGDDAIRHIIGLGLKEAIQALFAGCDTDVQAALTERYRQHFLHLDDTPMELFPGVKNGLSQLNEHGYMLAVATGKARRGLDRVLHAADMADLFSATRCADEAFSKPHPKMLEDLLETTGISADRAVMIGDTIYDSQMARNAGVDSVAVSYGVHSCEFLIAHGSLACLDSFEEICGWLQPTANGKPSAPVRS